MKLFTFYKSEIFLGMEAKPYNSTFANKSNQRAVNHDHVDHCIRLGNGNETTGKLLLSRSNPPPIIRDTRVIVGDLIFKNDNNVPVPFLENEFDPLNNIALILFRQIYRPEQSKLSCKDDHVVMITPNREMYFECLYTGEWIIKNNIARRDFVKNPIEIYQDDDQIILR